MSVSQWLLPLVFMSLISCQVGVGTQSPQPFSTPTPAPSSTAIVFSPEQAALIKKYNAKGVNPLLLTLFLKSESGLALKKDENTSLIVHSTRYPEDALALKKYLEPLPLNHVKAEETPEGQIFFRLFFSEAMEVETLMTELKQFPFVQSVQFNYDASAGYFHQLEGLVFDATGNPVPYASLILRSRAIVPSIHPDSLFKYTAKTDQDGKYKITFPEEIKEVSVSVNKPGYMPLEHTIATQSFSTFFDFGGRYSKPNTALKPAP